MAQTIPQGYFARNIEPIGYHDLNGKPAFKLAMQEVNLRWYLYVAHLWHRGWSVLDVTDPTAPEYCSFIPGPENTWTIQVQVAEGKMITGLERIAPGWGGAERPTVHRRFFHLRRERANRAETNRSFPNRQHGHASQFLRRRQSGSCRSRRAGADWKNLPHRRHRRSRQSTRSRPLFVAGADPRRNDKRLEIFLPRAGPCRRRSRLSFLRRRRRHHPRRKRLSLSRK